MLSWELKADRVTRLINKIRDNLQRNKPTMLQVAAMAHQDVLFHFAQSKGPKGPWKSIKRPGMPLLDTGTLRNSIQFKAQDNEAIVYTGLKYAAVHNFGYKQRNIAQRKFMYLSKDATKNIVNRFAELLVKK